jgi:Ca2+-binding RTX toxin-like protein
MTTILGTSGADLLVGTEQADSLEGADGDDTLVGGRGYDTLRGGAGDDTLVGGPGSDDLNGGAGRDVFRYDSLDEINGDWIQDFSEGDRVDLSALTNLRVVVADTLPAGV